MKFSNILEKLEAIFNLVIDSKLLTILTFLIIGTIILRLFNLINNKKTSIIIFLVELIILSLTIYNNNTYFVTSLNSIIDDLFTNFYFPSIYVYLFTLISSVILSICISMNKYVSSTYKMLNKIYFYTYSFINIALISELVVNKIDVLKKESLFTNNNVLILLEISSYLFLMYLVINILFYIANNLVVTVLNKKTLKAKDKETNGEQNYNLNLILEDNFNEKTKDNYDNKNSSNTLNNPVLTNSFNYSNNETPKNINLSFNDLVKETNTNSIKLNNVSVLVPKSNDNIELSIKNEENLVSTKNKKTNTSKVNLVPEVDLSSASNINSKKNIINDKGYKFIDKEILNGNIVFDNLQEYNKTIDNANVTFITKDNIDNENAVNVAKDIKIDTEKDKINLMNEFNKEIDNSLNVVELTKESVTTPNFSKSNSEEKKDNKSFTIDDYKMFSKMLRTVLENNGNRNNLTIKELLNKEILYKYTYDEYKRFEKILSSCMN